MTNKELFLTVVDRLKAELFLNGFKFRKRDYSFIQQEQGLRRHIELDHWTKDGVLIVYPIYMVRFDILLKWFESNHGRTGRIILLSDLPEICLADRISL